MKILFLDQSGTPGGAELCLLDIAKPYRDSTVGLLADGPFRELLAQHEISTTVFTTQAINVRKESNLLTSLRSLSQLLPLVQTVAKATRSYDLIYANTPKALVVGALASLQSRRPLVYHLHDIISPDHFSRINRLLLVTLANRVAKLVIANSQASQAAFVAAGGRSQLCRVVYNGFDSRQYAIAPSEIHRLRANLALTEGFWVGHFSRLSPWKGQHVLLKALTLCPKDTKAILVGDALFGEDDYVLELHRQVEQLGLQDRVRFLGFRSDIPQLMSACDLVTHTSTAPEPFGRVIVEAMLCGTPVVAAAAGGATELVDAGKNGWLCPPDNPELLAKAISACRNQPEQCQQIAQVAQTQARDRFDVSTINALIAQHLQSVAP
ncbi:glycosyl transferase, group 1 family protein [Synechococcus sp. PCC 7335]|uniref:glycosyltransferase n=1 Tax=Synechococcus sp. (strain ATCC 29403 / PCC 7335) TaxID=91464 RepID=UPI00017EB7DB|nr:glycosyltransferase [Synechococcus sp. PCC 7335]EDX84375.1 glycosyl transferase, group 1 family protein [Synechococcus sp. PCC 7335]